MEQTINTTETTLESTLLVAFAQLGNQLLEFQKSISAREPGNCFPNLKEVGMLCRLINCLAKLKKLSDPFNGQKAINAFAAFLAKEDKTLSKTLKTKYKEFTATKTDTQQPAVETTTSEPVTEQQPDTPPVSKEDFDKHKGLLFNLHVGRHHTTEINGQHKNTNWLQYNLFQWHLPRAERRFCHNENEYHTTVNHSEVCRKVKLHFSRHGVKKQ